MFRELSRKNKQLMAEACIEILTKETRGVLSVNGGGGYPYVAPMNHDNGCVYFRCSKRVKKA